MDPAVTSGLAQAGANAASSALPAIAGAVASLFPAHTILGSWGRSKTGSGLTGAQIEQNSFNADQARIQREWQETMDNTKVQRSVEDMKAAGVNPAMMMAGAGATSSTPSGAAASGGTPPAATGDPFGKGIQALFARKQFELLNSEVQVNKATENKINAEADNIVANTRESNLRGDALEINNAYLEEFNQLRNDGQRLENDVTRETVSEVRSRVRNLDANTLVSESQIPLNAAYTLKANMDAYVAASLLPYQQRVMASEGEKNIAQAQYALVQAAYQQGLIDNGYIEALAKEMGAEADMKEFETAVKTGDPSGKVYEGKVAQFIGRTAAACGALINASGIGNIFGGSVSKVISKK